jgi:hypothetical protein
MKRFVLALAVLPGLVAFAFPHGVAAQPLLVPGRDVTVVYRLGGAAAAQIPGGAPDGVRLLWDAVGQRLRTEPVGQPIYAITDLGRRVADIVFAAQNSYIEMRIKGGDPQTLLAGRDIRFTRRGTAHLIGMDCTMWAIHSQKIDGTGCITADGVVLRAEGTIDGQPGSVTAQSVAFTSQPSDRFVPPEGFFRLPIPGAK